MKKYTYEELKKWTILDLQLYIQLNISTFINIKKKKDELIRIILAFQ